MLKIGEFSKLSRVSVRMLRHYDEMGLLSGEKEIRGQENGQERGGSCPCFICFVIP